MLNPFISFVVVVIVVDAWTMFWMKNCSIILCLHINIVYIREIFIKYLLNKITHFGCLLLLFIPSIVCLYYIFLFLLKLPVISVTFYITVLWNYGRTERKIKYEAFAVSLFISKRIKNNLSWNIFWLLLLVLWLFCWLHAQASPQNMM